MKKYFTTLAIVAAAAFTGSLFAEQAPTKDVTLSVSEVYVPGGFSQDADAFVVVSGMFPNSCYKWSKADVSNTSQLVHEVKSIATVAQTMCLMVMIPYQKEVNLGRLSQGEHTLRFMNGDGTYFERTLTIE